LSDRRIRLVLYTDSEIVGGAEISAGRLLQALGTEISPTVLGTHALVVDWLTAQAPRAEAVVVPGPRRRLDAASLRAHMRALRRLRPDVVQLNLITPWSCRYALLAATLLAQRGVIAVDHLPQPTTNRIYRALAVAARRKIAARVAVGEASARAAERVAGLRPGSVRVIHNGVPDEVLRPAERPPEKLVVGSLGRLDRQKGYDVLVEALGSLPDAGVLLVGDGVERDALRRQATAAGVAERLHITGWQERPRDFLTAIDVFVLPSRHEGLPLAVVEAMLAALPVIASDVGSVREAVVDGETGFLVPPEDPPALAQAILRLAEDGDLRRRLGEVGRSRALRDFSLDAMARAYEKLYCEVA
jgi:glycosyltransferase involved in cell wall biosynthesis